ncbi:hypothetical protein KKB83_03170 [Patescibacteria group bacterium]|nr:hypothetical protein [Patescibacteria group bacterium]
MNRIYKVLDQFGLSQNEIKVYLEALKHAELSPFKIAKLTNIPRTTVYDAIMNLSLKGLVEIQQSDDLQKQQTRIKAKNPTVMRQILWEKRRKLVGLEIDILDILAELKGEFHQEEANADFLFYPGIEGAKKVYLAEDRDDVDIPIYVWECLMPVDIFGKQDLTERIAQLTKFRKQSGTRIKEIIPLNDWTRHVLTYQVGRDSDYLKGREIRFIDGLSFDIHQRIAIKGSRIRIVCAKDDEVWGLVIKSPLLAKTIGAIFQINWQVATPLTLKMVQAWGENEFLSEEKRRYN